jgi:hypothetical protein
MKRGIAMSEYKPSITVKKGASEAALSGTPLVLVGLVVKIINDHGYDISTNDAVEIITAASIVIAFVRRAWRNLSKQLIGENK